MTVAVDSNQDENQDATNESTSTAFMPPKPKFGGLTQVSSETWVPWTGGKPNSCCTELEDPDPGHIDPNQCRSTSIPSQAKSKHYRTVGLPEKLTKTGNLQLFQKDFVVPCEKYFREKILEISMLEQDSEEKVQSEQFICV